MRAKSVPVRAYLTDGYVLSGSVADGGSDIFTILLNIGEQPVA